jgi:hypothetical protein
MGSYYNPEVAKDYTQEVAAAWSKAASDVTGQIVKGIEQKTDEYNALSKKYIENRSAVEQTKLSLLKDLGKSTSGYLGNDWQDTFGPAINRYADLNLKIANNVGSPEERAQYQKELASIESTIDLTKEGVVTLASYSQNTDKQIATAGEQGGYAKEGDLNLTNALLCGNGKIGGTRKIIVGYDENTKTWSSKFSFQGQLANGAKWGDPANPDNPLELDATRVKEISKNGNNLLPIVPVIDNNIKSMAETSNLFLKETKTVDGKPVSTVKGPNIEKYYTNEGEVKTGETDTTTTFANKRVLNKELFKKDLLVDPEFTAQLAGLLSDPQGFVATLNNTFKQTAPDSKDANGKMIKGGIWTLDKLKDPAMLAEAQKLYTNSFAEYIATSQDQEIYDTDPITGKPKVNVTKKDALTSKLTEIERSFEQGNSNNPKLKQIPPEGLIQTVKFGDQPIKIKLTKGKDNKVTATRVIK